MNGFRLLAVLIPLFTSGGGRGVAAPILAIEPFVANYYVSPTGSDLTDGLTPETAWSMPHAQTGAGGVIAARVALGLMTDIQWEPGAYNAAVGTEWNIATDGSAVAPVRWRAKPASWVIFDSLDAGETKRLITISGDYNWVWDIDSRFTGASDRESAQSGSAPTDIGGRWLKTGIEDKGRGNRVINTLIHDAGNGLGSGAEAICFDSRYYGIIPFNNGWDAPDRPHGHNMYIQNINLLGKLFEEMINFQSYALGANLYGDAGSVKYMTLNGAVLFHAGLGSSLGEADILVLFIGGPPGELGPLTLADSHLYQDDEGGLGYGVRVNEITVTPGNGLVSLHRNRTNCRFQLFEMDAYSVLDNDSLASVDFDNNRISVDLAAGQPHSAHIIDRNRYRVAGVGNLRWTVTGVASYSSLALLQAATSWDLLGTQEAAPTGSDIEVRPNIYEPGRANIVCWNHGESQVTGAASTNTLTKTAHGFVDDERVVLVVLAGGTGLALDTEYFIVSKTANTFQLSQTQGGGAIDFTTDITDARVIPVELDVDLSPALSIGEDYKIHHAFNLFGAPVLAGTYAGGTVVLPQTGHKAIVPYGALHTPISTRGKFNVFVVRKAVNCPPQCIVSEGNLPLFQEDGTSLLAA